MMIRIDIDKIGKLLGNTSRFSNYHNMYSWLEVIDELPERNFEGLSLLDIPEKSYSSEHLKILYRSYVEYVCFGKYTLEYGRRSDKSRILFKQTIYRDVVSLEFNNHCWMTPEMLTYWLDTGREELGLDYEYKLEITPSYYYITYDFKKLHKGHEKYVLFWGRYSFEYPASLYVLDAMILKQDYYKEELLNNLLILVSIANQVNPRHVSFAQCLTVNANFMDREVYRERIKKEYILNLSSTLYTPVQFRYPSSIYNVQIQPFFSLEEGNPVINWKKIWLDEEIKQKRFDKYKELYEVLNDHRIRLKKECEN